MSENATEVLTETRASVVRIAELANGTPTQSAQRKVRRWIEHGCVVRGRTVKLDAVRIGGKYVSSEEAFRRFFAACNDRPAPAEPERTPAQQLRDSKAAMESVHKRLAKAGVRPLKDTRTSDQGPQPTPEET